MLCGWGVSRPKATHQEQVTVTPAVSGGSTSQVEGRKGWIPVIYWGRISSDCKYVCVADYNTRHLIVWELGRGQKAQLPIRGGGSWVDVRNIQWAPNTGYLAVATEGMHSETTVFDPQNWQPLCQVKPAIECCWSPSGQELAYRGRTDKVFIRRIGGGNDVRRYPLPTALEATGAPDWSRNNRLALPGARYGAYLLDPDTGQTVFIPQHPQESLSDAAWSPSGEDLYFHTTQAPYWFGLALLYNEGGTRLKQRIRLQRGSESMSVMRWAHSGKYLAVQEAIIQGLGSSHRINIYRTSPFARVAELQSKRHECWHDCEWTQDDCGLHGLRGDGMLCYWDLSHLKG